MTDHPSYLRTVLGAESWNFVGGTQFTDPAEFDRSVREHYVAFLGEDIWLPHQVAFDFPRIRILYFGLASPEDDAYSDFVADIQADDGVRFTAGELLRKLNNAAAPHLDDADHRWFEGLIFHHVDADGVPVYEMRQGS